MKLTPYSQRRTDDGGKGGSAKSGKNVIVESASSLYMQLEKACADGKSTGERYDTLRYVFRRAVEQAIADCQIAFVGFFSKVDYCVKEYNIPHAIANLI